MDVVSWVVEEALVERTHPPSKLGPSH